MNADWRKIRKEKNIYLRRDPSLIASHTTIRATGILWNLISLSSSQNKKNSKENGIYLFTKEKKSNTMIVKKLDTSNEIANSNNSNHSNIFKKLYR